MTWIVKSDSDSDTVYAKVTRRGRETGVYRYVIHAGHLPVIATPEGAKAAGMVLIHRKRRVR
jgi:hypothetical protein